MKDVCQEYGILLMLDEVMCGIARTGYVSAWQKEGVVPDIQLIGKGLGGSFFPISGMLIGHHIAQELEHGPSEGAFLHGHTFQNSPLGAATAQAVIDTIMTRNKGGCTLPDEIKCLGSHPDEGGCTLLEDIRCLGIHLGLSLKELLGHHRYVGDIRGIGLMWGVSFSLLLIQAHVGLTYLA